MTRIAAALIALTLLAATPAFADQAPTKTQTTTMVRIQVEEKPKVIVFDLGKATPQGIRVDDAKVFRPVDAPKHTNLPAAHNGVTIFKVTW